MDYNTIFNLIFCQQTYLSMSSLVLYTHIPTAFITLIFGWYVWYRAHSRPALALLGVSAIYAVVVLFDVAIWRFTELNSLTATLASVLGILIAIMFFLIRLFARLIQYNSPLHVKEQWLWIVLFTPIFFLIPADANITGYSIQNCTPIISSAFSFYYIYIIGFATIVCIIAESIYDKTARISRKLKFVIVGASVLFVATYCGLTQLQIYIANDTGIASAAFGQISNVSMAIFIAILAFAIVRYEALSLQIVATRALIITIAVILVSMLVFTKSNVNRNLILVSIGLFIPAGYMLLRSTKELQESNEAQKELLRYVSYEVKAHLTAAQNCFALIADNDLGTVPDKVREMSTDMLNRLRGASTAILQIIESSGISSKKLGGSERFDLSTITRETIEEFRKLADSKGLTLTSSMIDICPVVGNAERFKRHVISNIIENAILYTPRGNVIVTVEKHDNRAVFSVRDTGVGISTEDMRTIFTEGSRGIASRKVNVHSTGFGLFFAKHVVNAHHGTIKIHSAGPGTGTRVDVELPLSPIM